MSEHEIHVEVNGHGVVATVPAQLLLVDWLRENLNLTGTKDGCGVGVCGACSVLIDGSLQSACLIPVVLVDGASIRTVEGLSDGDELTALQDAFVRHGGFQCGICTPGQLVAAVALLSEIPEPSPDEIRRWLTGNLCRCTGYFGIIDSVLAAARPKGAPARMAPPI